MSVSITAIRDLYTWLDKQYPTISHPQFLMLLDILICEKVMQEDSILNEELVKELVAEFSSYNNLLTGYYIQDPLPDNTPAFDNDKYFFIKEHHHLRKACILRLTEYKERDYLGSYTISRELIEGKREEVND